MESLDLELEFNALRYNSHFESDFDSPIQLDECSERIIERSNPKPAKIKREISRLAEPYQPHRDSEVVRLRAVDVDMDNRQRCRFGRLLVSRIVAGNDRSRTLTGILTSWRRGSGRRSSGQFTRTRRRGIN